MAKVQPTDLLLVNRNSQSYQITGENVVADLQDTDLLLVNRDNVSYKITGAEIKESFGPAAVEPELTSVTLIEANPNEDPRFTNQSFVSSTNLTEDGVPPSEKTFDAYVEGTFKVDSQFKEPLESVNTSNSVTRTFSSQFSSPIPVSPNQGFNGDLSNWAFQTQGNFITWNASGALTGTYNKLELYTYGAATVQVNYGGTSKSVTGPGGSSKGWIVVPGPFTEITEVIVTDTSNETIWAALRIDGEILIDNLPFTGPVGLQFASGTDMSLLAPNDEVTQVGGILPTIWSNNCTAAGGFSQPASQGFNDNNINFARTNNATQAVVLVFPEPVSGIFSVKTLWANTAHGYSVNAGTAVGVETDSDGVFTTPELTNVSRFEFYESFTNPTAWYSISVNNQMLIDGQGLSTGPTGTVASITNQTVLLSASYGTWAVGEDVLGPQTADIQALTKKYLKFDSNGAVSDLLDNPQTPPYVTADENPGLTLTFPATFPSGETPDEEIADGATLTVEVTAVNDSGTSGPRSATVQPEGGGEPPVPEQLDGMTVLYTGTGSTNQIVNGIDLVNDGGLVWIKSTDNVFSNLWFDTLRGAGNYIVSNNDGNQSFDIDTLSSFKNNGFEVSSSAQTNNSGTQYVAWTFQKKAKYFDVVEYTGNGTSQTINYNLGQRAGFIIVKGLDQNDHWFTRPTGTGMNESQSYINLDEGNAFSEISTTIWNNTPTTTTGFEVGADPKTNNNGSRYIAYCFAGYTENEIKCGTYTGTGSSLFVETGFKPQWIMTKNVAGTQPSTTGETKYMSWRIRDSKRGLGTNQPTLRANTSDANDGDGDFIVSSTGFTVPGPSKSNNNSGTVMFYMAIAAPPAPDIQLDGLATLWTGNSVSPRTIVTGIDYVNSGGLVWIKQRDGTGKHILCDTVRGATQVLSSNDYTAQTSEIGTLKSFDEGSFDIGPSGPVNGASFNYVGWSFAKASKFFDIVEYTGNGTTQAIPHSLTTKPGFIIVKSSSSTADWGVYSNALGINKNVWLNLNNAAVDSSNVWVAEPTDSDFTVGSNTIVNNSGQTYIAYLFAEDTPGVIKCGMSSTSVPVNVGFEPQFLLVKADQQSYSWRIIDNKRGTNSSISPNNVNAEELATGFSFSSNGFTQNSGTTMLYVTIAASPDSVSMLEADQKAQALNFATYENRKQVVEGTTATNARAGLITSLISQGYSTADVNAEFGL